MAKQSGLHQIRGKVGEHSYYRQTGISSGLIRSINQGMSARVKNGEEYANTRLNNLEFGAACNAAGLLGQLIVPKYRPMVLPFSQSKLAKDLLRLARQNTEDWGQRTLASDQVSQICDALNATSKRNFDEFASVAVRRTSMVAGEVDVEFSADQNTKMASLGIDNLFVDARVYDVATGKWNDVVKEMATGYFYTRDVISPVNGESVTPGDSRSDSETFITDQFVPAPNHAGMQIIVFIFLPAKTINGVSYTLQEYCSFKAMPIPAFAGA